MPASSPASEIAGVDLSDQGHPAGPAAWVARPPFPRPGQAKLPGKARAASPQGDCATRASPPYRRARSSGPAETGRQPSSFVRGAQLGARRPGERRACGIGAFPAPGLRWWQK